MKVLTTALLAAGLASLAACGGGAANNTAAANNAVEAPPVDEWAPVLYQVAVHVEAGSGRAGSDVRLTTLRLGPPPPSGAGGP